MEEEVECHTYALFAATFHLSEDSPAVCLVSTIEV